MSLDIYDEILQNEIQVLRAVYEKEFSILFSDNYVKFAIKLPIESIKDSVKNFINLKVEVVCDLKYPKSIPEIIFSDYWGLDDSDIAELYQVMRLYLAKGISEPEGLIFNLIQQINDRIDDNIPRTNCSICLAYFTDPADVFVTPAHHYFHEQCIGNYAVSQRDEHARSVRDARANNQFIEEALLPKLDMKCPLCKTEDLVFDRDPQDLLNEWRMKSRDEEKAFLSEEILTQMAAMRLEKERQDREILRRQALAEQQQKEADQKRKEEEEEEVRRKQMEAQKEQTRNNNEVPVNGRKQHKWRGRKPGAHQGQPRTNGHCNNASQHKI